MEMVRSKIKSNSWDRNRSHDFVSIYNIRKEVDKIFASIEKSNEMTNLCSEHMNTQNYSWNTKRNIDILYEMLTKCVNMPQEEKTKYLLKAFNLINADVKTRVEILAEYKDYTDFTAFNNKTIYWLETLANLYNSDTNNSFDLNLMYALNLQRPTEVDALKINLIKHLSFGLNDVVTDTILDQYGSDTEYMIELQTYIQDIIYELNEIYVCSELNSDESAFYEFIDSVTYNSPDLGFMDLCYDTCVYGDTRTEHLDILMHELFNSVVSVIMLSNDWSDVNVYYNQYKNTRNKVLREMRDIVGSEMQPAPVLESEIYKEFTTQLVNIGCILVTNRIFDICDYSISRDMVSIPGRICAKLILLILHLCTHNREYLEYIDNINAIMGGNK